VLCLVGGRLASADRDPPTADLDLGVGVRRRLSHQLGSTLSPAFEATTTNAPPSST
jgi:hypothetical protein